MLGGRLSCACSHLPPSSFHILFILHLLNSCTTCSLPFHWRHGGAHEQHRFLCHQGSGSAFLFSLSSSQYVGVQITIELAKILHGPDYSYYLPSPMNFHVQLFKDRNGIRRHSGSGSLTLQNSDIALQFLREYGGGSKLPNGKPPLKFVERLVKFSKSNHPARPDIVRDITHRPYADPLLAKERERVAAEGRAREVGHLDSRKVL